MAGLGRKTFIATEVLTAANVNGYLMDQSVMKFASSAARSSAIGTAVSEGMVSYLSDTDALEVYNGSSWGAVSSSSSGNAVINGAMDFWQRGTSIAHSGALTYTADRWLIVNSSYPSGSYTVTQQTFTPGTAPVAGYEGRYFLRYAVATASGATYQGLVTKLEDVRTFAGQTVTLSFWAKADASRTITPSIGQEFGSSAFNPTMGTAISVTTSWARYSQTFSVPSITGKTIGAANYLEVFLNLANAVQTIDIWGVQLEAGSTATAFKRNAPSLQAELAACQRYYQRVVAGGAYGSVSLTGNAISTSQARVYFALKQTLRTLTGVTLEYANLTLNDGSNVPSAGTITVGGDNENVLSLSCSTSGLTQFRPYILSGNNNAAGYLAISAEL